MFGLYEAPKHSLLDQRKVPAEGNVHGDLAVALCLLNVVVHECLVGLRCRPARVLARSSPRASARDTRGRGSGPAPGGFSSNRAPLLLKPRRRDRHGRRPRVARWDRADGAVRDLGGGDLAVRESEPAGAGDGLLVFTVGFALLLDGARQPTLSWGSRGAQSGFASRWWSRPSCGRWCPVNRLVGAVVVAVAPARRGELRLLSCLGALGLNLKPLVWWRGRVSI